MPTARVSALVAAAGLLALPLLSLAVAHPALAGASRVAAVPSPAASESSAPQAGPTVIPLPSPTPAPTRAPTPAATKTVTPSPKPSPTPKRVVTHTFSPRPRLTQSQTVISTAAPVTGGVDVGSLSTPTASATRSAKRAPSKPSGTSDNVTKLIALVVGGAFLLGAGGIAGLYLTRHRHDI